MSAKETSAWLQEDCHGTMPLSRHGNGAACRTKSCMLSMLAQATQQAARSLIPAPDTDLAQSYTAVAQLHGHTLDARHVCQSSTSSRLKRAATLACICDLCHRLT